MLGILGRTGRSYAGGVIRDPVGSVERLVRMPLTAKEFREQVLGVVRHTMPFAGHVFALTDPVTRVSTSPHADVPTLPWERLPELIRWRYLTRINRVDTLPAGRASSLRSATRSLEESLVWRHVQRDLGVTDTASITFGDRYGTWGYLELLRTDGVFDDAELEVLTAVAAPVTTGLRGAVARTFTADGTSLEPVGPAVVVLGPDLHVQRQTEAAADALLRLLPPDEPMAPIPAAAYNIGAALVAVEEGVPLGEPWARVHLGANRWVTVRASRLGTDIAVSIEPSTPVERMDLFARSHGLSSRESEVIALLGVGLDSKEIAGQLFLSEHTVNDHVKAALAKTGARTRQVMLARATGSR